MLVKTSLQFCRSSATCCLWICYGNTSFSLSCNSHSTGMCHNHLVSMFIRACHLSAMLVSNYQFFRLLFYWVMVQIFLQLKYFSKKAWVTCQIMEKLLAKEVLDNSHGDQYSTSYCGCLSGHVMCCYWTALFWIEWVAFRRCLKSKMLDHFFLS